MPVDTESAKGKFDGMGFAGEGGTLFTEQGDQPSLPGEFSGEGLWRAGERLHIADTIKILNRDRNSGERTSLVCLQQLFGCSLHVGQHIRPPFPVRGGVMVRLCVAGSGYRFFQFVNQCWAGFQALCDICEGLGC